MARAGRNNLIEKVRTAAISLKFLWREPQKTESHGGAVRLCLRGSMAEDRGRVRSSILFCYGRHGPLH
jgi:hypothetical protein